MSLARCVRRHPGTWDSAGYGSCYGRIAALAATASKSCLGENHHSKPDAVKFGALLYLGKRPERLIGPIETEIPPDGDAKGVMPKVWLFGSVALSDRTGGDL